MEHQKGVIEKILSLIIIEGEIQVTAVDGYLPELGRAFMQQ